MSLLRSLLSLLLGLLALAGGTAAGMAALEGQPLELLVALPLLLTLLFPWRLIRRSFVPLGQIRAAHLSARLVEAGFGNDPAGGAAMAAAMALIHKTNASDEDVQWVEEQVAQAAPLRPCGLVAAALLRARVEDREGARLLLRSVEELRFSQAPALAFLVAREWLAADAAERGTWGEIPPLAAAPGFLHTSRATLFLGAVAARLLRRPGAPSDERLWALWLLAPARRRTRPLLRRALASSRLPLALVESVEVPCKSEATDALQEALALQVRAWSGAPSLDDLTRLGDAWDRALQDPALARRLLDRSVELGVQEVHKVQGQLQQLAASQIAEQARVQRLPLGAVPSPGATLQQATFLLRSGLLASLETSCDALRRRAVEKRPLPPADEWRAWLAIRASYEQLRALAGEEARRLAWPRVKDDLCKLAVWLWNERSEKTIAHAMFRWLLAEATALQDAEVIALQKKNVDCGAG
jgi:hypothetical protein